MAEKYSGDPEVRWYFWDGGFLAIGRSRGVVPTHAHHAFQLCVTVDQPLKLSHDDGPWQQYYAAIVRADEKHAYDGDGMLGAMLLIDPETREGKWLAESVIEPVQSMLPDRIPEAQQRTREFFAKAADVEEIARYVEFIVRQFCVGIAPHGLLDERIAKAIDTIGQMDARVVALDDIASQVFLSPSRFAHLFSDEVGIPFRRYLLWRRLTRAMVLVSRGNTLSHAAHAAGFSDSAHLTRTFYQMFGIPPTAMLTGRLYEIPAPFQLARATKQG